MKIEVANGEIVDKLTILKIKLKNSDSDLKTEQILKELEYLVPIVDDLNVPQEMIDELQEVNQNEKFVQLARDVYYNNDERFHVKSKINKYTNSQINEQKILPKYL